VGEKTLHATHNQVKTLESWYFCILRKRNLKCYGLSNSVFA
jgi:hypothetical protein